MSEAGPWVMTPHAREAVLARAREVWRYRRILGFFARKAVQALYAKTYLGPAWIFIRTLVPLAIGSFVFGSIMNVPSGGVPYFLFFLVGQIPWNCFDGPVVRGSRGLEVNREMLTRLYIPRMVLPLAQMGAGLIEPAILLLVLGGTLIYYRSTDAVWYVRPTMALFASLAIVVLILCFAFALTLWTSVWQARARDTRFVVRYMVGFWLYFTPVIYPLSVVPSDLRWLMLLNPLSAPIETFRWGMFGGPEPPWGWLGYSAAVTAAVLATGAWHFARMEDTTIDRI